MKTRLQCKRGNRVVKKSSNKKKEHRELKVAPPTRRSRAVSTSTLTVRSTPSRSRMVTRNRGIVKVTVKATSCAKSTTSQHMASPPKQKSTPKSKPVSFKHSTKASCALKKNTTSKVSITRTLNPMRFSVNLTPVRWSTRVQKKSGSASKANEASASGTTDIRKPVSLKSIESTAVGSTLQSAVGLGQSRRKRTMKPSKIVVMKKQRDQKAKTRLFSSRNKKIPKKLVETVADRTRHVKPTPSLRCVNRQINQKAVPKKSTKKSVTTANRSESAPTKRKSSPARRSKAPKPKSLPRPSNKDTPVLNKKRNSAWEIIDLTEAVDSFSENESTNQPIVEEPDEDGDYCPEFPALGLSNTATALVPYIQKKAPRSMFINHYASNEVVAEKVLAPGIVVRLMGNFECARCDKPVKRCLQRTTRCVRCCEHMTCRNSETMHV